MSLSVCAECLSRLRISTSASTVRGLGYAQAASFHTTAAQYKSPLQKKKVIAPGSKGPPAARRAQSAKLKKKVRERPKLPPIGERKAQRQRIVLSNTNAIPLTDLEVWSKANMSDENKIGQIMALDGELLDQLRDAKAFKTTQNWSIFRRPATLIRRETVKIAEDIQSVEGEGENVKKVVKHLVHGERGSGKSILMLQAMSMAYMNEWLVLNIPEAQDLVNSTSSYHPSRHTGTDSSSETYLQPRLTQLLLRRATVSNESVLKSLKLNHAHAETLSLKPNATLHDLVKLGAEDFNISWATWRALLKELTEPGANPRPPVLVAADGVDHWMGPSAYRNPEYKFIHAHQFALVKQFLNFLFPKSSTAESKEFVNGGMVFFSTSGSNTPNFPTFSLLLSQLQAIESQQLRPHHPEFPQPKAFSKPDERVLALLHDTKNTDAPAAITPEIIQLTDLKGLTKMESRGYMEYFARSGLLHQRITDKFVSEMIGLSGGGVVGELAKLGRRVLA